MKRRKNAGKRQLELSYTFPFRFSHSLYSLPNSPLKKTLRHRPKTRIEMHSKTSPNGHNGLRARPARVTSHHKNKQHDIRNGLRRQVNRSRRLRTYFFIFFFFFSSRLKEVQQRRRRQIGFFSREYIYLEASGHGSRSLSVRSRERGRELKAVVRRGTKGVLSWTRSRLVTKCMSGK